MPDTQRQRPRANLRQRVLRTARAGPALTVGQVAALVGCHRGTAAKHLRHADAAAIARRRRAEPSVSVSARAAHPDPEVRCSVASGGPPRLLSRLAADPESVVRTNVATHVGCPAVLLARLAADTAADEYDMANLSARRHPDCPPARARTDVAEAASR